MNIHTPYGHHVGSIPSSIQTLSALTYLNLCCNKLAGKMMISLMSSNIMSIIPVIHYFVGTIPSFGGSVSVWKYLNLNSNKLTGEKLQIRCDSSHTKYNYIAGSIPSSLGTLSALTFLHLCCNSLTGDI